MSGMRIDEEYKRMQGRLDLLEEIYRAEEEIDAGNGVAHDEARAQVLARLASTCGEPRT